MADNKVYISVRLRSRGADWLDRLADKHRVTRSDIIRAALVVARKHEKELEDLL